jgi:hypothetical protein
MRFYFWSESGHIVGAEVRPCAEIDAFAMAQTFLDVAPLQIQAVEAWASDRFLARVERGVEFIDRLIVKRLAA